MERSDPEQEGITLHPVTTTRYIARDEAEKVIREHLALCPFAKDDVAKRLRVVEITIGRLVGFMLGSGLLGGAAGGAIATLIRAVTQLK